MIVDGLRWEVRERGAGTPLLLLHGFTGRGTSWGTHAAAFARVFRVILVDLPGHGRTAAADPARITVERTADDLATILRVLGAEPAAVLGYSFGARVALRLAVAYPASVARLVLESASAGLATEAERAARRAADGALADRIECDGIEAFTAEWERNPVLVRGAPASSAALARRHAIRLANRPVGLAASLRAAGQGAMEPLHDRLAGVTAPTLVIAGALDPVRSRAVEVAAGIPAARLAVIDGAGHTPHDDQPKAFRRLATEFLQEDRAA